MSRVLGVEISAQIGSLTLKEPFVIARDTTTEAEVVWVEIEHEGERGYGEANPIDRYEESAESALAYVEEVADSLGDDPFAFELIESRLPEREYAARAAIDAALHDLCGKLTGLPVWRRPRAFSWSGRWIVSTSGIVSGSGVAISAVPIYTTRAGVV